MNQVSRLEQAIRNHRKENNCIPSTEQLIAYSHGFVNPLFFVDTNVLNDRVLLRERSRKALVNLLTDNNVSPKQIKNNRHILRKELNKLNVIVSNMEGGGFFRHSYIVKGVEKELENFLHTQIESLKFINMISTRGKEDETSILINQIRELKGKYLVNVVKLLQHYNKSGRILEYSDNKEYKELEAALKKDPLTANLISERISEVDVRTVVIPILFSVINNKRVVILSRDYDIIDLVRRVNSYQEELWDFTYRPFHIRIRSNVDIATGNGIINFPKIADIIPSPPYPESREERYRQLALKYAFSE